MAAAEDKLRAGNLTIPRYGEERAALGDYRAVLALDPDNERARAGIREIADYFAGKAGEAIAAGRWEPAGKFLNKATDIDARRPALAALRERLAEARRSKPIQDRPPEPGREFRDELASGGMDRRWS